MANNGPSNQGIGLEVQRLTLDNLSGIPRRNNIIFLSDYLQEQHSYAKGYASEGLAIFSSCNDCTASPVPTLAKTSAPVDEFLLGTPVLKARAPAAPVIERSSTILKALEFAGGHTPVGDDRASRKSTRTKKLPGLNATSQDNSTRGNDKKNEFWRKEKPKENKKRTEDERRHSDGEHFKRLQERRERKRFKKNIMKSPPKESESEKENPRQCTKIQKGDKKGKTNASFALMHGFTATNVGKRRITLEPLLRNVGVFKKGKTSCASKTGKIKKRSNRDGCFSETLFLERAKAKSIENIDFKSSSGSSSSSGKVHKTTLERKEKLAVFKKGKEVEKIAGDSVDDSDYGNNVDRKESPTPEQDRRSYDPANSIIWDIERESCVEESEAHCRQGTIVLRYPFDLLARGGDTEERRQDTIAKTPVDANISPRDRANVDATFIRTSDGSLHPSQSASQVVREQPDAMGKRNHERLTFSKYFVPENVTMKEVDKHKLLDSYGGFRSDSRQEEKLNRSMFHQPPPRTEAHLASPTLSQMIPLDLVDELPRSSEAFSIADVRSVPEDTMELDDYGAFHFPDAPQELEFWSRSDIERIPLEPGLHSMQHHLENHDNFMEHDKDPPMFQAEDSCCSADEHCHQNLRMGFAHEDGIAPSDWNIEDGPLSAGDIGMTYEAPRNDTFSRMAPSDLAILSMPSVDGSSEDSMCAELSPTRIDHFSQGRSLLYGLDHGHRRVSDAETEVAKLLKQNHWLPHRL